MKAAVIEKGEWKLQPTNGNWYKCNRTIIRLKEEKPENKGQIKQFPFFLTKILSY